MNDDDHLITASLDATASAFATGLRGADESERRLALLYELATLAYSETQPDTLWQQIVECLVQGIPGALRGALLVAEEGTGRLLRVASLPLDKPSVSRSLARRAIEQQQALVWSKELSATAGDAASGTEAADEHLYSIDFHRIASAMYAPLLWKDRVLGVVCVDNNESSEAFGGADLQLLQASAHIVAMSVANLRLQEELQREMKVLANFLKLTSPQLAGRLRQQRGAIRLGGEFCEATIMFADLRGFTALSARMEPDDVTDMLEDYFGQLVPIVFEHGGTIDKFVGDAIVAVFGSPEPDDEQQRHAIEAALQMQAAMREVNARREAAGRSVGMLGIGIHFGAVVHGFIGSRERMEFTVIGDAVNRASRYCDGAAGGEILISPEVYQRAWSLVEVAQTGVATKHEGELPAFCVSRSKANKEADKD